MRGNKAKLDRFISSIMGWAGSDLTDEDRRQHYEILDRYCDNCGQGVKFAPVNGMDCCESCYRLFKQY